MGAGLVVFLLVSMMQGVSCQSWSAWLPQSIVGIAESCLTIPCGFRVPGSFEQPIKNCSGGAVWRRGNKDGTPVFNGSNPTHNKIQGRFIGDLKQKNCTTMFLSLPKNYGDLYFFRLECPETILYSFHEGVNISVQTVPSPPKLTPVEPVSEGHVVTLQCSVPVPCSTLPPSLTWLPQNLTLQEETQLQQKSDGLTFMTSTLTFFASADHHNRGVACLVSYPLTKGGSTKPSATTQRLNILYAPRSTVAALSMSSPVSEGSTVALMCSSDANPPVRLFTWYKDNGGRLTKRAEGEMLILQVRHNDSGLYLCEARTQRGSQRSTPVSLQVITLTTDSGHYALVGPYIICGGLLGLFILVVAVGVHKYKSLSRRLKQMEQQRENPYTDLKTSSMSADYDHIQWQPKVKVTSDASEYENLEELKSGSKGS
ncbi:sialoadhesin isoform X2 [Xyrichtys novacula]|uniref:Sialoadhesin isoform X2 n=1 Tax=Xyrichtys novacula TaxID=13765 RepID=A0AAV1HAN9_XYRNO|nr:sialoadhesin isoform X2 [Xyrichtys novacula]